MDPSVYDQYLKFDLIFGWKFFNQGEVFFRKASTDTLSLIKIWYRSKQNNFFKLIVYYSTSEKVLHYLRK